MIRGALQAGPSTSGGGGAGAGAGAGIAAFYNQSGSGSSAMSISLSNNPGNGMSLFRDRRSRRRISRSHRSNSNAGMGSPNSDQTIISKSFQEHMIQVAGQSLGSNTDGVDDDSLCPVCGTSLTKFPQEKDKERHISECLDKAQFGNSKNSQTNRMLIYQIPERKPAPEAPSSSPPQLPPLPSSSSDTAPTDESNQAPSVSSNNTPSTATPAPPPPLGGGINECVICFEEFEPGDRVGRLECLCVYHEQCILGWFQRKGVGSCPIHAIQK